MTVIDNIEFDPALPLEEQSAEMQQLAWGVFSEIDFTDMSALDGDTCVWSIDRYGLRFTATRVFIDPTAYSVREHLFNVSIV